MGQGGTRGVRWGKKGTGGAPEVLMGSGFEERTECGMEKELSWFRRWGFACEGTNISSVVCLCDRGFVDTAVEGIVTRGPFE